MDFVHHRIFNVLVADETLIHRLVVDALLAFKDASNSVCIVCGRDTS